MSAPEVSILLPAYNAGATLDACLRSVARQTFPRWECIVVDDGSEDGTRAVAERFAARDERFRVVATAHQGLVAALGTGLERCLGRMVARMDADDVMHRERLAAQLRALDAEPALAAVGCHVRLFPRRELSDGLRAYERWLDGIDSPRRVRAEAFVECPVAHPTLMVRTDVLRAAGYRDEHWPEDYDLVLRLLGQGREIGVVPRRLLAWRDGPRRLWRAGEAYRPERFTACKAAFLAAHFLAGADRYVLWGYGPTGRALRRALARHGKRPSHVVEVHPGRIGEIIHGAPVISVDELRAHPRRPLVAAVAGERPPRDTRRALRARLPRDARLRVRGVAAARVRRRGPASPRPSRAPRATFGRGVGGRRCPSGSAEAAPGAAPLRSRPPRLAQLVHGAEERRHVDRRVVRLAAQLAVRALHVEEDALGLGPARVRAQVRCAAPPRAPGARRRSSASSRRARSGGRPASRAAPRRPRAGRGRAHHGGVECHDLVERRDPALERTLPADRRAEAEEDVTGEDDARGGEMTTTSPAVCAGPT